MADRAERFEEGGVQLHRGRDVGRRLDDAKADLEGRLGLQAVRIMLRVGVDAYAEPGTGALG